MTRMTKNGVSTCTVPGTEKYEEFINIIGGKPKLFIQYDYRHTDGELFSCVRPTLEECRMSRDKWIAGKKKSEPVVDSNGAQRHILKTEDLENQYEKA